MYIALIGGGIKMSSKRKPKEIRVDKLIIKADEVVIIDESKPKRWDPWLGRNIEVAEIGEEVVSEEQQDSDSAEENVRRPFSWI